MEDFMSAVNKVLFVILACILIIGVTGLLWVGMYNVPSYDDYAYAAATHEAWTTTHSLLEVFKQALVTSKSFWNGWQGLYSSAVVLSFMPNIFGEGKYVITAFLTIGSILIGNTVMIWTIAGKLVKAEKIEVGILVVLLNIVMLQRMPSAVQGIYWYNGAMNYTFFYALLMIAIAIIVRYALWTSKKKDMVALTGLSVLGFVIEGGNHVTAFLMLIAFFMMILLGIVGKNRKLRYLSIPFVISLAGFIFNVTSPGTKVRQSFFTDRPGFFGTIKLSVQKTLENLNDWLNFSYILILFALIPMLLAMVVCYYNRTKFDFSYPILIVVASVGCLCLMRCPPYYAMGGAGAGRLSNLIYFMFVMLSVVDEFYILGWLYAKGIVNVKQDDMSGKLSLACIIMLFAVSFYGMKEDSNFYMAFCELKSGEARQYGLEAEARWEVLLDENVTDVVLQPFSVKPELLYFSDVKADPTAGQNSAITKYYKKNSIRLSQ